MSAYVTLLVLIFYEDRRFSPVSLPFIPSDVRGYCNYLDNHWTLLFSLAPRDVNQPSCSNWNAIARSQTTAAL